MWNIALTHTHISALISFSRYVFWSILCVCVCVCVFMVDSNLLTHWIALVIFPFSYPPPSATLSSPQIVRSAVPRDAVGNYRTARNRLNGMCTVNRVPGTPTECVLSPPRTRPSPTADTVLCENCVYDSPGVLCINRCIKLLFFFFYFCTRSPHRLDYR